MPRLTAIPRFLHQRRPAALALLALVCAALLALAALAPAARAEDKVFAHAKDGSATYTSIDDAWQAACSGTAIVMDDDWLVDSTLNLGESQTACVMMNGHKMYRDLDDGVSDGSVVQVSKNASLTLDGTGSQVTFTIKDEADRNDVQVKSGGLITGGMSTNSAGGVEMKEGATLALVNVAVSGNQADGFHGGGVAMNGENCSLIMTDAAVEYNVSYYTYLTRRGCGGGVYINNEKCSIAMTRSSISHNRAELGGGVYSDSNNTTITMNEGSQIDDNEAYNGQSIVNARGGGVYFNKSCFKIEGDGTASISLNTAMSYGGGICIAQKSSGTNEGSIKGVTFNSNTSSTMGGGIYDEQEYVTVENCSFSGNWAGNWGGAIDIENDHTTVRGCTFKENHCGDYGGAIYNNKDDTLIADCTMTSNVADKEGGAIFTSCYNDIHLSGVVVVKGNHRSDGAADDIFLNTSGSTKAYLQGSLEKGSKVGVRTGDTGDRRIAKNFSDNGYGSLFIDMDGYFATYGTDSGGDAWQRQGTKDFQLTANGTDLGTHKPGDTVSATATTGEASEAFWRWSAASSKGLEPFADYVSDATSPTATFAMPQNDVTLVADYIGRTEAVALAVDAPRAGEKLAEMGVLSWEDDDWETQELKVALAWSEVAADGTTKPAQGTAQAGATYVASAVVPMNGEAGLAFALDMGPSDVGVKFDEAGGTSKSVGAASASVDAQTETLSVTSNTYTLAKPKLASVDAAQVSVAEGVDEAALRAALPTTASGKDADGNAVALAVGAASADLSALLSGGHVAVPEGGTATVSLPVSGDAVDNPDGLALEVTVTVEPTYLRVEFDAAGGTDAPGTQSVRWGACAQAPDVPVLAGSTFAGWYAEGAQSAWDFKTPVTANLKLTARWEPIMLSVAFDAAGGTPAPEAQSVAYGSCAQQPSTPSREGCTFLGWFAEGSDAAWDFGTPVTSALTLTAKWQATPPSSFIDVPEGAWYHDWVYLACERGLMMGYQDGADGPFTGCFGPEDAITRGQVATVLWRMAGEPEAKGAAPFGEGDVVPGKYYYKAVAWCYEQGIVTGYESGPNRGLFLPDAGVSREELALMVTRFERWAGLDTSGAPAANFERCADKSLVSSWAVEAVTWTAASGVLGGKEIPGESGATTYRLDPQQGATRAQAAKVFARAWEIQRGAKPYEAQASETPQATDAPAQSADGTSAQEATFDDVTFEDVAADSSQADGDVVYEQAA